MAILCAVAGVAVGTVFAERIKGWSTAAWAWAVASFKKSA